MSLSATTLSNELTKLFDSENVSFVGWPNSVADVASNWGNAYHVYAQHAVDTSGDPVASVNKALFISTLQTNLPSYSTGTAALAAQAFSLAFAAYWTGALFSIGTVPISNSPCPNIGGTTIFSTEIASVVSAVVPATLQALLLTEFSNIGVSTAQEKADRIAQAFHTATTTAVLVLITGLDTTPPPAGPLPIVNTCYVF